MFTYYWSKYPREAQIRFAAYASTSVQQIHSKKISEDKGIKIAAEYSDRNLPINPFYCGFRVKSSRLIIQPIFISHCPAFMIAPCVVNIKVS